MNLASVAPVDLAPVAGILLLGAVLALGPLWWVWRRHAAVTPARRAAVRWQALSVLTLCLTFDLVLFGAFTRLTDSGLGCPDWPGCYGSSSPLGAQAHIAAAQSVLPSGPVTHAKAWIEMTHRYLATGVGALIVVLAATSCWSAWHLRVADRLARSSAVQPSPRSALRPEAARALPIWAIATLAWVCLQGLFGALTVTMKLYPLIVTAHLLGGMGLLALLAVQVQLQREPPLTPRQLLPRPLWRAAMGLALLSALQIALGGWVSTHYAVLACSDFPTCQGSWWPPMDFRNGFALLRDLNAGPDGGALPFEALTAIHYMHRLSAYVVLAAMAAFAWCLWRTADPGLRRWATGTAAIACWQLATGVSNVVLGWPLVAAVGHTAGAAAWVVLLASLLTRASVSTLRSNPRVVALRPLPDAGRALPKMR